MGRTRPGITVSSEVTVQGMERWLIGHSVEISHAPSISVAELRRETETHGYVLNNYSVQFMQNWLAGL